ncbi:hypothetical protein J2128_001360 [Methanomicrobium sp. W14]|uniref:transglutaminase-like domain-containing protein n=1 Tax=Methanomicrobium sp. W14 TaxID=2817839 RepID=UPI001AE57C6F|nr:transglutaminase-like domain-containing protein [Methanomicrobium sp. W14]MBP2133406.1 hypothetical protein [Methanomicrobium sp. W14]
MTPATETILSILFFVAVIFGIYYISGFLAKKRYLRIIATFAIFTAFMVVSVIVIYPGGTSENGSSASFSFTHYTDGDLAGHVSEAMDYTDPDLRNAALGMIGQQHGGNYNLQQVCDVYDYMYKYWVYVNDPNGFEYMSPASDSVKTMKGDCDDFAILMGSLVEGIGGSSRIIIAENGESGHAYAEVYIADNPDTLKVMTDSLRKRYGMADYCFHVSTENGRKKYWLNLDWTAGHPGGSFFENSGQALIIRPDGKYSGEYLDVL